MNWADPISLEPVFEVAKADGKGMTDRITIAHANELGLLPRVTGVIEDMLGAGYSLQQYLKRTCILATEQMGRQEGEDDEDYVGRIAAAARKDADEAKSRGKDVHAAIRDFLQTGSEPRDSAAADAVLGLKEMLDTIGARDISAERTLGGRRKGLVGTPDVHIGSAYLALLEALCGSDLGYGGEGSVIVDLKVTNLSKFQRPYREHKYQLGGYSYLKSAGSRMLLVHWYVDAMTGESRWVMCGEAERWQRAFLGIFEGWIHETGYDPRG